MSEEKSKKTIQEMVTEFHTLMGHPIGEAPCMLDDLHHDRRVKWMKSEIVELEEADTLVDQADALADLIYFAVGFFVEMGVPLDKVFEIVHKANMRKFTKRVAYDIDGKVTKPDNWLPPESEIAMLIDTIKIEKN